MLRAGLALVVACLFVMPGSAGGVPADGPGHDVIIEVVRDEQGRVVIERGLVTDVDGLAFERRYWYADHSAKPENPGQGRGGGGGGDGGGDPGPGTDCSADQYKAAGWRWSGQYSAYAADHAEIFDAAGRVWDDATSASIFGGVQAGRLGAAGAFDGVNQFEFVSLGASSTIAVTTTWYYRGSGEAVESDGQYNTYYDWATDGSDGAMDVLNIAVHEVGHTFGLDHPNGPGQKIGCLSMYAYGSEGETQKRTLGDGDILGIQALYGA